MTRTLISLAPMAVVFALIGVQALTVKYRRKRAQALAEIARLERQERRRVMIFNLLAGEGASFWDFAEEQFADPTKTPGRPQ